MRASNISQNNELPKYLEITPEHLRAFLNALGAGIRFDENRLADIMRPVQETGREGRMRRNRCRTCAH